MLSRDHLNLTELLKWQNATWSINSLQIFRKQLLAGNVSAIASASTRPLYAHLSLMEIILPILAALVALDFALL